MINFRYHIVSLMAVFLALAVGIAVGVSLGPSVDTGLLQQATQDRRQVTDLRAQLDRGIALDQYRQAFEAETGKIVTAGELAGVRVAVVLMPDAPAAVARSLTDAVIGAGGSVVREVRVNDQVFDPARKAEVDQALENQTGLLNLTDQMSPATKVGMAVAFSFTDRQVVDRDPQAVSVGRALTGAGLANVTGDNAAKAQLVFVVTAETATPALTPEALTAHLELELALRTSVGVVLAGPNSGGVQDTDVLQARTDSEATDRLSTVDVADLSSGVTTTILAGKEQLLNRAARHYGAMSRADAALPELPVR